MAVIPLEKTAMDQSSDDLHERIQRRRDRRQLQTIVGIVAIGTLVFMILLSGMR